jgi:hypothetical protein
MAKNFVFVFQALKGKERKGKERKGKERRKTTNKNILFLVTIFL